MIFLYCKYFFFENNYCIWCTPFFSSKINITFAGSWTHVCLQPAQMTLLSPCGMHVTWSTRFAHYMATQTGLKILSMLTAQRCWSPQALMAAYIPGISISKCIHIHIITVHVYLVSKYVFQSSNLCIWSFVTLLIIRLKGWKCYTLMWHDAHFLNMKPFAATVQMQKLKQLSLQLYIKVNSCL